MRVINPQGRVVSVSEKTWEFLKKRKDFQVYQERSSNYKVPEALKIMESMSEEEIKLFLEGETRKSLCTSS